MTEVGATPKQVAYIRELNGDVRPGLTKDEASRYIRELQRAYHSKDAVGERRLSQLEKRVPWKELREGWRVRVAESPKQLESALLSSDGDEGLCIEPDEGVEAYREGISAEFGVDPVYADKTTFDPTAKRSINYIKRVLACAEDEVPTRFPEQISAEINAWSDVMPSESKLAIWRECAPKDRDGLRKMVISQLKLAAKEDGGSLTLSEPGDEGVVAPLFGATVPDEMRSCCTTHCRQVRRSRGLLTLPLRGSRTASFPRSQPRWLLTPSRRGMSSGVIE
jgi:hypothetical protein